MRRRQGSYAVQAAGKLPHILVVMVTIKQSAILVCASLALSISSLAMAADSTVRINNSRGMSVNSAYSSTISYNMVDVSKSGNPADLRYVADVNIDGFLMCNEFAADGNDAKTELRLRPLHGAWLLGNTRPNGTQAGFTRISDLSYANGTLNVSACNAEGTGAGCGGAALQCYTADAHGRSVADTRHILATGFDEYTGADNSSVEITNIQVQTDIDHPFEFTVKWTIPSGSPLVMGGNSTQSLPASDYILQLGYDRAVFSDCSVLLKGGSAKSATGSSTYTCSMIDQNQALPGDVPVVMAALFTNSMSVTEPGYSDNVAFGYPVNSIP